MSKRLYFGINIFIFSLIAFSILMTTNWFFQVQAVSRFQLKLHVLEMVFSWRFLFNGWPFEILFESIIGPACIFTWYSCRKNKFIYPYMIVIFLTLLLTYHCYVVTGFNVIYPFPEYNPISRVHTDLIPLHFIPFYFYAVPLVTLTYFLYSQSKNKYGLMNFNQVKNHLKYVPYLLIPFVYVFIIILLSKP